LCAQVVANLAIDARGVARSVIDQFEPALAVFVEVALCEQIRGLHDGFDGIAQVVG